MQKNKRLILAVALLACCGIAFAQGSFTKLNSSVINGVSHDGTHVVGNKSGYTNVSHFCSYVYDVATGETTWATTYDELDYDKSGQYMSITNTGIIVGAMKNKDMLMAIETGDYAPSTDVNKVSRSEDENIQYVPVVSAAVWRNGKTYCLGMGNHTVEELIDETDGTYAVGASEDGSTVIGYLQSSWIKILPCIWTYNANRDAYDYQELALPAGFKRASAIAVSADGKVIVGEGTNDNGTCPIIWTDGTPKYVSLGSEPYSDSHADAVSSNGRFVLMHGNGYGLTSVLVVYDTTTGDKRNISIPNIDDVYQVKGMAITDEGDSYCTISYTTDYREKLFYYDYASSSLADINYYLSALDITINGLTDLSNTKVSAVSSDGKVVAGNSDSFGGWVLTLSETEAAILNAPQIKDFFFSGANEVTVRWLPYANLANDITVKQYKVYVDGSLVANVDADSQVDGVYRCKTTCGYGSHTAYVVAVAEKNGKRINSATSEMLSAYLSAKNNLPLVDNFDDVYLDSNNNPVATNDYWTAKRITGDDGALIKWSLDGNNYENSSPYMCTISIGTTPWQSAMTSPFVTTEQGNKLFVSFYTAYQLVNIADQDLTTDYLDIEYSTDGENWNLIKSLRASDMSAYNWRFVHAPIEGDLSGKPFQIRFLAHGQGRAMLKWNVDCVCLNNEYAGNQTDEAKAIKGDDGKVKIMWHNSLNAYELSRINNTNVLTDYCTGSEGVPLITAVDLKADDVANHVGSYISAVSAFIFDNPYIETTMPTQAEAIVYVDGQEQTRQKFTRAFDEPVSTTVTLANPVKIETGKKYRIAVRIFNYDPLQTPIYYTASTEYEPGHTDLFSEDEGKTWQWLSDVYTSSEDPYIGKCIWPIRAHVTEQPMTMGDNQLNQELIGYNLYRNGEVINDGLIYAAHPFYTDDSYVEGATYSVRTFYKDCTVSDLSLPVSVSTSSIDGIGKGIAYKVSAADGQLSISGDYDNATVYDASGAVVGSASSDITLSHLPQGIYMLRINSGGKVMVEKIVIR